MSLALHHVFVCVSPGASEAALLDRFGLVRGSGTRHAGQGTRNIRYFFQNAYLELIWIDDPDQARSPLVRPTGLCERCRWRETGASPFGIALCRREGTDEPSPFATWAYRPPYLPAGASIEVADSAGDFAQPLVFIVPSAAPPNTAPTDSEPRDHPAGMKRITAMRVTVATDSPLSDAIRFLVDAGIARATRGQAPHLELVFDDGGGQKVAQFEPQLPLTFRG